MSQIYQSTEDEQNWSDAKEAVVAAFRCSNVKHPVTWKQYDLCSIVREKKTLRNLKVSQLKTLCENLNTCENIFLCKISLDISFSIT